MTDTMKKLTGFIVFQATIKEPDDQFTWIVAQIPFGPQVAHDYPEVQVFCQVYKHAPSSL